MKFDCWLVVVLISCCAAICEAEPNSNYTIVWTKCQYSGNSQIANLTLACAGTRVNADMWLWHRLSELWLHFRLSAGTRRQQERRVLFDGEVNGCELLAGRTFNPFVQLIYLSLLKAPNILLPVRCPIEKNAFFVHDYHFQEHTAMFQNLEINLFLSFRSEHGRILQLDVTGVSRKCVPMIGKHAAGRRGRGPKHQC